MKVTFCIPTITRPHDKTLKSLEASAKHLDEVGGFEHTLVSEIGNPYISNARNLMLRKALDWGAEVVVFIDHDLSWPKEDLLKLLQTQGDCVGGLYRFTKNSDPADEHAYMGTVFTDDAGIPIVVKGGTIKAELLPAGFLKVTRDGINRFMAAYPELLYGERCNPHVDLFNHGAMDWLWYGEDYAMSKRWREKVGDLLVQPDLSLTHWRGEKGYPGNFHEFIQRQPGGVKSTYISASAA